MADGELAGFGPDHQLTFDEYAQAAQRLHARGHYGEAAVQWAAAHELAPTSLEKSRVDRGHGVSLWQLSRRAQGEDRKSLFNEAEQSLYLAQDAQAALLEEARFNGTQGSALELRREVAETHTVVGRILAHSVISNELEGTSALKSGQEGREIIARFLRPAHDIITAVEAETGKRDQYWINLAGRHSVVESLYGDQEWGRELAHEARIWAKWAESARLYDSARLSFPYVAGAKARAFQRAVKAEATARAVRSDSPRWRRVALTIGRTAL